MYSYRHPNSNIEEIEELDSSQNDVKTMAPPGPSQRQVPLAFTNTPWGQEYAANVNWERDVLLYGNPSSSRFQQGTRFRSPHKETGIFQAKSDSSRNASIGLGSPSPSFTLTRQTQSVERDASTRGIGRSITTPPHLGTFHHAVPNPPKPEEILIYLDLELPPVPATYHEIGRVLHSETRIGDNKTRRECSAMDSWYQFQRVVADDNDLELDRQSRSGNATPRISSPKFTRSVKPNGWMELFLSWDDYDQWRFAKTPRRASLPN